MLRPPTKERLGLLVAAWLAAAACSGCGSGAGTPTSGAALGVNDHPEQPIGSDGEPAFNRAIDRAVLNRMQSAGVGMVRVPVPWFWIEPKTNRIDWHYVHRVDDYVQAASERGMRILMTVGGPPCWATSFPRATCGRGYVGTPGPTYPPRMLSGLTRYSAFVARRWGSHLAGIEVLNEPDHPQHLFLRAPGEVGLAKAYAAQVKATYRGVKRVAPAIPVVAGALAGSDGKFLQRLYDQGIQRFSDAISIHPYNVRFGNQFSAWPDPHRRSGDGRRYSFSAGIPWIHRIMVRNGDAAKPLWLTEFGFPTCAPSPLCLDQTTQARYLGESLKMLRRWPYVKVALAHEAHDSTSDSGNWLDNFGLLRENLAARPAYCALARATGVTSCRPDPLSPDGRAQDTLIRAWEDSRTYYLEHGRTFRRFDPGALTKLDSAIHGFPLQSRELKPTADVRPTTIGVAAGRADRTLTLCNASPTTAYCVVQEGVDGRYRVRYGKSAIGTWEAVGAVLAGASSTW